MNTKIKLLITLVTGMFFFTSCDNGTTTTTDKDNIDTTKMSNLKNDTMNKKMDDMKKKDNGLITSMNKMMDNMSSMKMTGDFDMDFANMMIEHHQGAIDMSKIEVAKGTDEKIKGMAQNIITKQNEEIGKMQEIIKNYKPSGMEMGKHDELSKDMDDMKAKMNGMQMTGNTDKDFAMMMISHHESAIKMFKDELSHGMNSQLKQMAQKGISDQTKEISEFKSWLNSKK
jgi:uncharacterized protein (DUF305 family)